MSNIKRLKLKIASIIMLVVMLSLEFSPFAVKATAQQLQFYSAGSVSVGYDSYNSKNVFYGYSTLGGNIAYCVDYTCPLPSGTMSFSRYLSDQGLAVLVHGYPNISAAALGVNNNEEAYMATQMAFWEILNRTGESHKSGRVFRVENVTPKSGMEGFYKRTTAAAAKLVAMAESSPVSDNPTLVVNTQSVQKTEIGNDSLLGPYYMRVDGMTASKLKSMSASLEGAPASARLTDANGNNKSSFGNGDAVYVRLASNEGTTSFKLNFHADFDRKVGLIYSTSGNVQDYAIIDTIPNEKNEQVTIEWEKVNYNGEIELVKVDQDNQPVGGAEFNLVNSNGEVLATRKTGSDGKINFYNVPAGNYTLVEVSAPEGYTIKNKTTNLTVKANEKTPVKVVNDRITGKLIITKVDDESKPLKGATFEIYNSAGTPITQITTNAEGKASVNVEYGKYYFKEISAPAGYTIDDTVYEFSVTNENRTFYKTVVDKVYKGTLVIIKKDDYNKPIENVKFDILNSNGEVIKTITTNAKGMAGVSNLVYGTYYYQEVEAPANVVIDNNKYEFKITENNQVIQKEIVNKTVKGKIEITKVDNASNKIANVKFNILDENSKVVETITTNKDGVATSKELPMGNYYYQEVEVPAGYVMDTNKYSFAVTNSTTIKKTVINKVAVGQLKVIKYDNAGNKLAGVTFNILDEQGNVVDTITTGKDGSAITKTLKLGTYYYQEISAPSNVKIDTTKYLFKLSTDGQIITKNIVNFYQEGKLKVIKVDENNKPLQGVKFNILDSNKNVIDTIVTDKNGVAESKDLEKGSYYFQEIEAPAGIIVDNTMYDFKVEYDGQVVIKNIVNNYAKGNIVITKYDTAGNLLEGVKFQILDDAKQVVDTIVTDKNGRAESKELVLGTYYYKEVEAPANVVIDTSIHEFVLAENKQVVKKVVVNKLVEGTLKIIKVDENEKPIAGVKFNIYDSNKNLVDTMTTDSNGVAVSGKLVKGNYYYQEVEAPAGIIVDNNLYDFVLESDGQNVVKNMVNYYAKGKLVINKYDSNMASLANVKFNVLDDKGNIVDTLVTDKNGKAESKDLVLGTYYYQEVEAPANVVIDTTKYEFKLKENNQVVTASIVNQLVEGTLKIIKVDENEKPLAGVKFNIYDANKKLVDTMTTNAEGVAVSGKLEKGNYYYQEVEAPAGIIVDNNLYDFVLESDGQNVVKNMINYYAKGKLVINKYTTDNRTLANVKFEITDAQGNVVDTLITDKNGKAESKNLVLGTYYYQEVEAPAYVIKDTQKHEFKLNENNEVVTAKVYNKLLQGKIIIHKVDEANKPVANVTFDILDGKGNVIDTITTNAEGVATSKELPDGNYYYQEKSAPAKYRVDSEVKSFNIFNAETIEVTVVNYENTGKLHIIKVDENDQPLEGIKFNILDEDKNVIDTIVTNRDGIARSKEISLGTYYYQEIEAPEGIVVDNTQYQFTVEYDGQNVIAKMVNYYAKGTLEITKIDSKNRTLSGVVFNVLDTDGNVIDTLTTDKNGKAESKKLMLGTYYYQEVSAPDNVVVDTTKYEFKLNENNQVVKAQIVNKVVEGRLHIIKVDENSVPLQGIKFNIYTLDDKLVDTIVTDENGVAESKDIEKGTYYFQEIEAPENIVIDTSKHEFTVEYDGQNVIGKLVNNYVRGQLQIVKLDEKTNAKLEGAKFVILDANRNEVETITTNAEGIATSSNLLYGTYYFKEVEAPSKYIKDDAEYTFTITTNAEVIQAVVYNKKQEIPKTGGLLSSDAQIVLLVSMVAMFGYVVSKMLEKREEY